ncbi:uncharacterized protein EI90DRAFT_1399729 [Cantharellus anzutake]|uniref:uncharacterized protein n=1 Tax=Cantharellus anzutake TaxID=1750568 RepID=UPI001904634A|nr:uncharacterized protein EI90DRAFT_1399729 [Cantharellus anzutake]KAF8329459.1 hypothetical protein EI90DRAFT_1399729 [Cantharellus anzutake]
MIASFAFVFGLLSLASALPLDKRIVPTSQCTTIATGFLKTTNGHKLNLDASNKLSYSASGLEVDVQNCQPNFGRYDGTNGTPTEGHLVVKSTGKCLSLQTPYSGPPFTVTVDDCYYVDDSGSTFSNFIRQSDGTILFAGNTQEDGSYHFFQNQCAAGTYGVSGTATSGIATLQCSTDANIVALKLF